MLHTAHHLVLQPFSKTVSIPALHSQREITNVTSMIASQTCSSLASSSHFEGSEFRNTFKMTKHERKVVFNNTRVMVMVMGGLRCGKRLFTFSYLRFMILTGLDIVFGYNCSGTSDNPASIL